MLDGSQTASYEITLFSPTASYKITLVGQSVRLSIHLSITKFSQDWIIVFSDFVHDDSWPWDLVTEEARLRIFTIFLSLDH